MSNLETTRIPDAAVLLSGGPDSAVVAALAKQKEKELLAIYVFHGAPFAQSEFNAASQIAKNLGIPIKKIDITGFWKSFGDVIGRNESPMGNCADNYALVTVAVNYVGWGGGSRLYLGTHKTDVEAQPWLPDLFKHYEQAAQLVRPSVGGVPPGNSDFSHFQILLPLLSKTKAEVLKTGTELRAPLELSWSCVRSGEVHCGECFQCKRRHLSFRAASINDPTEYKKAAA